MASNFSVGGLSSGLDSNSIIETYTSLASRPIELLKTKQAAIKTQISVLGDLASKLNALGTAASKLKTGGVFVASSSTENATFSSVVGSGAALGRFSVRVQDTAGAAKARTATGFASPTAPVTGGSLDLSIDGTNYSIAIADGASLTDVAYDINHSGAPVSATLITSNGQTYLSLTNRNAGFVPGASPSSALTITENSTGSQGTPLGLAITSAAKNAVVWVDGLQIERRANQVTEAIPGVTLNLKAPGVEEELVVTQSLEDTAKNLEAFASAYNDVMKVVQRQLAVTDTTVREKSLVGDPSVRALQQTMARLTTTEVPGLATVRSLADVGIKSARDGSLSVDRNTLAKAIDRDPTAVDALFTTAGTGLADVTQAMVNGQTKGADAVLTARTTGLNKSIRELDDQAARMQARVDKYRENLVRQFAAMEKVVSGFKATGNFLDMQAAAKKQE